MMVFRLLIFLLVFSPSCFAASFSGKLVTVTDGDTVEILHNGKAERIRLHGIDAPESGQPYGTKSKKFVLDIAAQKVVTVEVKDTDQYGRTVGEVILPSGKSLNRELVREGYAWWYRKYSDDASLGLLEAEAREEGEGLWKDKNPIPPWEWRRGKKTSSTPQVNQKKEQNAGSWKCGQKRYCGEMSSCEEAKFYLKECGLTRLDGDGDGVPCESLCM